MTPGPPEQPASDRAAEGRSPLPAPGGPHDPAAPGRLEPVRADRPDPDPAASSAGGDAGGADTDPDEVGPGPEGADPMVGDAPSG